MSVGSNTSLVDASAQPSEFHTLVDTACSIIEAPHQQRSASPMPGNIWDHTSVVCNLLLTFIHHDINLEQSNASLQKDGCRYRSFVCVYVNETELALLIPASAYYNDTEAFMFVRKTASMS